MLKVLAISGFAIALMSSPVFAQSTAPPADQSAEPSDGASKGKSKNKEMMANCRSEAKSKGLKGPELKASVHDCVAAQNPKAAARMQCHQQGKAKGLADDALKAFVKTCVAKGK